MGQFTTIVLLTAVWVAIGAIFLKDNIFFLGTISKPWEQCNISREEATEMAMLAFDINQDGSISYQECVQVHNYYLTVWTRLIDIKDECDSIFTRCDHDHNGFITSEDILCSKQTCIKDCNSAKRIKYFFGHLNQCPIHSKTLSMEG